MYKFKIVNKIEQRVNEYQRLRGSTKSWIADQVGISKSRLYQVFKGDDMMLNLYARFAIVLECSITDLFEIEVSGNEYDDIDLWVINQKVNNRSLE